MVSTLDILYIVLALCSVMVTVVLLLLGFELLGAVRDVRRISKDVEHIAGLVDRVASVVFPGMERVAKGAVQGAEALEKKVTKFLNRK
jgi:protein involved in ribonucleotide reduction